MGKLTVICNHPKSEWMGAIAQVKEAFFTPLQEAERAGIEPTI
ncbi:hypothetical protein [Coleofasciculus sp. G2-EDA-02]